MKPIIILVTEDKDGYIKIKKEEFEKYIEQAYLNGVEDGGQKYNHPNPFGTMRDITTNYIGDTDTRV